MKEKLKSLKSSSIKTLDFKIIFRMIYEKNTCRFSFNPLYPNGTK